MTATPPPAAIDEANVAGCLFWDKDGPLLSQAPLKVQRSAVGSGSGRHETARPMSQLGRTEPSHAGTANGWNRRSAGVLTGHPEGLKCADTGHSRDRNRAARFDRGRGKTRVIRRGRYSAVTVETSVNRLALAA